MCNKGIETLSESEPESECHINQEEQLLQQQHQVELLMDSPTVAPCSGQNSCDENPRVKFLCSFSGSILPRPHDGKLRYVGGETRIVSVPRDITYDELMVKMKELYEGATVLKYQQPDEDLDALVSVVNDDDVTNMMEEYDKLGAGDGFTRLRIFLFSPSDQDGSIHFIDGDERDNERRYVDALNSLNESPDYRRNQLNDSQFVAPLDDGHAALAEQFFSQMNLDGGLQNQRNTEMAMPHNLRQLNIPTLLSGQPQQRYNEMEAPWSPAYYSPRQPGYLEPRQVPDFPTSPSSGRYRAQYAEFSDRSFDRPETQMNHHPHYEHQHQFSDNLAVFPSEKAGFPGNILHGVNVLEGNSVCEHCRVNFQRNQVFADAHWKPGEHHHLEPPNVGNGLHHVATACAECPPNREILMLNPDANLHHPYYQREQDPRPIYTENQSHERGRVVPHQTTLRPEEVRSHASLVGRLPDHHIVDNNMSIAHGHVNVSDPLYIPPHYVHPDDPRYARSGPEMGQMFHHSTVSTGSHMHGQPIDERVRYGNPSYAYGHDSVYPVTHGHTQAHASWRNVHGPLHTVASHEVSSSPQLASGLVGPGFIRMEASPSLRSGIDNPNPWVESSQKIVALEGSHVPDYGNGQVLKFVPSAFSQENQLLYKAEVRSVPDMLKIPTQVDHFIRSDSAPAIDDKLVFSAAPVVEARYDTAAAEQSRMDNTVQGGDGVEGQIGEVEGLGNINDYDGNKDSENLKPPELINTNPMADTETDVGTVKPEVIDTCALETEEQPDDRLSCLPELIAAAKKATLDCVEEVKSKVEGAVDPFVEPDAFVKQEHRNETDAVDTHGDLEVDSDSESSNNSRIELTKAEEEAINRGLQTIKNEDLEEIRELGSGTYGAVFHGKWKGSDVAIKRIKASCFAGRPSERERLISDFWKEALILSSLHHPNVVSFYGVVRDGPDGSLATVTEFMVNGSLKQFLQKKDRTIDRRKRLMIAMDTAFGMEYLHGKNIVHFDLKCENLLVNMRDPHRPVCKIGDLGLSKVKQHTLVSGGVRGTLPWMAPELLSGKSNMVSEKIDVYSYGIVMWELLTGDEPYKDRHCASIIGGIVNNTLRPQIPTWCDPEWKLLMESCWTADPKERPSFSEISQKLRSMAAAMNLK
ncbi:OLC1v1035215C1 [Oldenlandia corymbosa var. corymbosa]|uniref:OLC1v1035215C1 n=1 Tax=Oldenlandia corymbosa var. corymbosa TaxID=529605 RepID=A0AAV1CSJ2_OLDCO|nr:OLC1v1035215C1 [Oldenlandia corymbosa var. corymbosa]